MNLTGVNSHGLWACANTNNPYKVGDGFIFIPDFPRFVMNDDVHVSISMEVGTTIDEYSHDLSLFSRSTGYMQS
jgi:hypothetical protein